MVADLDTTITPGDPGHAVAHEGLAVLHNLLRGSGGADADLLANLQAQMLLAQDPMGIGYMTNSITSINNASSTLVNQTVYTQLLSGGYPITKLRVAINVQVGNFCLALYSRSGSGASAVPGSLIVSTGSIAVPAKGIYDIPLGGTYTPLKGDFVASAVDNTTVSYGYIPAHAANTSAEAWFPRLYVENIYPCPTTPSPVLSGNTPAGGFHRPFYVIGVA